MKEKECSRDRAVSWPAKVASWVAAAIELIMPERFPKLEFESCFSIATRFGSNGHSSSTDNSSIVSISMLDDLCQWRQAGSPCLSVIESSLPDSS